MKETVARGVEGAISFSISIKGGLLFAADD